MFGLDATVQTLCLTNRALIREPTASGLVDYAVSISLSSFMRAGSC